jgi:hypothetical protein
MLKAAEEGGLGYDPRDLLKLHVNGQSRSLPELAQNDRH